MRGRDGGFVPGVVARGFGVVYWGGVPGAALQAESFGVCSGCITDLVARAGITQSSVKQQLAVGIVVLPGLSRSVR